MSASSDRDDVNELLAAAYELDSPDANRALYARWAATYDDGFIVDSGYRYHEHVAALFAQHCLVGVAPSDVVVDIGCGTGLAGRALREARSIVIDGLDISPEMLGQAARKQHEGRAVYRRLIEADLTVALPVATDAYAGALSVGTFTHGHVGPDALDEILRIVRPGGHVAIGINAAHFVTGFADALDRLEDDGRLSGVRLIDVPIYDGGDEQNPDHAARVVIATVGGPAARGALA